MTKKLLSMALLSSAVVTHGDITFKNGDFETADLRDWTLKGDNPLSGGGSQSTVGVAGTTSYSGGLNGTIANITSAGPDPRTGGAVDMVYSGAHSARVGDEVPWGGDGSYQFHTISQTAIVDGATPGSLFFAWAAVEEISGHDTTETPFFRVHVTDVTQGVDIYDVAHYETDGGFWVDAGTGWKYSQGNSAAAPGWQVENLDLAALGVNVGDTLLLEAIARDCNPTAHAMYVYLDGFGDVAPPPGPSTGVPDSGSSSVLLGLGILGTFVMRKKMS